MLPFYSTVLQLLQCPFFTVFTVIHHPCTGQINRPPHSAPHGGHCQCSMGPLLVECLPTWFATWLDGVHFNRDVAMSIGRVALGAHGCMGHHGALALKAMKKATCTSTGLQPLRRANTCKTHGTTKAGKPPMSKPNQATNRPNVHGTSWDLP